MILEIAMIRLLNSAVCSGLFTGAFTSANASAVTVHDVPRVLNPEILVSVVLLALQLGKRA